MTSLSLFEDCQSLIEREQDSWKSYFNRWEVFAKYEEVIPESDLIEQISLSNKPIVKKKKRQVLKTKRRKTLSLITQKKNERNHRKIIKKRPALPKTESNTNSELCVVPRKKDDIENEELETNLKSFFRNFLKENQNKFEIFGVLSLAYSDGQGSNIHNLFFKHQQAVPSHNYQSQTRALSCMNQQTLFSKIPRIIVSSPVRKTHTEYLSRSLNFLEYHPQVEARKQSTLFSSHGFSFGRNLSETNLTGRSHHISLLRNPIVESKPLDWDFNQRSPVSVCRKINKEYFIKRTFPKMNITPDGKRFRNSCLHKRTNSVSLSMEISKFTTPERKPPERKCFSENVSQRKRRCPSKLFFDYEEDSESDDQTENRAPLIRCRNKKPETQIITEVSTESDSDDCGSIFDRINNSPTAGRRLKAEKQTVFLPEEA